MRRMIACLLAGFLIVATGLLAQTPQQPKVQPGPGEPNWDVLLKTRYGLSMFVDLANPVVTTPEATPGRFRKAGVGPVRYTPLIALGLETTTRGGWYVAGPTGSVPKPRELWSYRFKNTTRDLETGEHLPPPLREGSTTEFDPGDRAFGLWIANDGFTDGGVFTEPGLVAARNRRLASQPYKAMIYPFRDKETGKPVPNCYLIGWEYSTNDDFQDVVTKVENVRLLGRE